MSAAASRRRAGGGNLARLEALRIVREITRSLAASDGLDAARVAERLECDVRTVERYLFELVRAGAKIEFDDETGVWRTVDRRRIDIDDLNL